LDLVIVGESQAKGIFHVSRRRLLCARVERIFVVADRSAPSEVARAFTLVELLRVLSGDFCDFDGHFAEKGLGRVLQRHGLAPAVSG
jgi:hypothetical protein